MGNCVGSKGGKKDPKKLTDEEIKLLMDNTRLTKPQILALHRNFLKECPSGKLTKKDFVKLFKEVHPSENKKEKADKFCEYVFKVIDKEKLGYISFQEFVLCFILTSDGDFKDKCEFAFQLYDLDKDNKISKKEMTQVLTALYDLSGITDRKGNAAPTKKVDDIIRKINAEHKPAAAEPLAEPAAPAAGDKKKGAKPAKAAKPSKAGKPAKGPEFITKDQFIAACNADEQIKQLFVDSIFCGGSDAGLSFSMPSTSAAASAEAGNLSFKAPTVSVNTRSAIHIDEHDHATVSAGGASLSASAPDAKIDLPKVSASSPIMDAKIDLPKVSASAEAPSAEINAEAPSAEVKVDGATVAEVSGEAPAVSVEAPAASLSVTAPSVDVNVDAPSVEVKTDAEADEKKEEKKDEDKKEAQAAN